MCARFTHVPEYEDFDLDRSTQEAWDAFSVRLAEVVSMMDDTSDLTIGSVAVTSTDRVPFVTFTSRTRDRVRAEAASNAVLDDSFQLTSEELDAMERLGWQPPTAEGPDATPNFWAVEDQEESGRIAELAVSALRDVYGIMHPVFLAPDQLAEILTLRLEEAEGVTEFDPEDVSATVPASQEHLDGMVEAELAEMFGHQPLRDSEGDIAIRVGSSMLFLRTSADGREVILFASVVHDIAGRSRAMEVLSDLNTEVRMVKFQLIRDRVFVTMSVLAHPFVPAHLHQAVRILSDVADGIDEELAAKLDGRTTFDET